MRHRSLAALLAAALVGLTPACTTSSADSGEDSDAAGGQRLNFANVYAASYPVNECGTVPLAEEINDADSELDVTLFDGGQLGGESELLEQLITGQLEMAIVGPTFLEKWHEPIGITEAPYLFETADDLMEYGRSERGMQLREEFLEKTDVRILDMWLYGTRHVMADGAATAPEDFGGTRMRSGNTPLYTAMIDALGASPTPMPLGDVYIALQQGMISSVEGPIATAETNKFNEVITHAILTGHTHTPIFPLIAEDVWQGLSTADQELLTETVTRYGEAVSECLAETDERLLDSWRESGEVTVVEPEDIDLDAFRESVREQVPGGFSWDEEYRRLVAAQEDAS